MSGEAEQIKLSYEKLGMSVLDIAENRRLEPEAVKATLMSCSPMYRKACEGAETEESGKVDDGLNFTDEQLQRVNEKIFQLAMGAESEVVQAKMAIYIRDDKKGRHDVVKTLTGVTFNVLSFNEDMKRANQLIYGPKGAPVTEV